MNEPQANPLAAATLASVATAAPTQPLMRELLRRILVLAAPTSLIAFLQAGAQLIETWLAARQGTAALAGWAVVLPFALLLQQMSTGAMGGGVVSAIARALGAGKREEASSLGVACAHHRHHGGAGVRRGDGGLPARHPGRGGRANGCRRGRHLCDLAVRRRRGASVAGQHAGFRAARRWPPCTGGPRAGADVDRLPYPGLGAGRAGRNGLAGIGAALAGSVVGRRWPWPG
ncbi:MATE family efflux transporter [Cupriavidus basilensis]